MSEYTSHVRRSFLQYLANTHTHELKNLGICKHGRKQMKKGLDPDNEDGIPYAVDVDHVIERAGSGTKAFKKNVDSLMLVGSTPTYEINHFSNLFFMPNWIHSIKNELHKLQGIRDIKKEKWMLTIVPEIMSGGRSGFIARSQKPDHPLHTLPLVSQSTAAKIVRASYKTQSASASLEIILKDETVGSILEKISEMESSVPKQKLSKDFNAAVSRDLLLQNIYLGYTLYDANRRVKEAFEAAKGNATDMKRFERTFETSEMGCLYKRVAAIPLEQAEKMHKTMQYINGSLSSGEDNKANQERATFSSPKP